MRRAIGAVVIALLAVSVAGCKVTSADIDYWMGTQKGPGKIVAVLLADKYEDELRVHSALALVRMEPRLASADHQEMVGVNELAAAVRSLPDETQARIVNLMVPELLRMMTGADAQAPEGDGAAPEYQVRAKDAAYLMIPYATGQQQQQLVSGVVGWFVEDFNGRSLSGNFTAEQVVRQLGAPAATLLVDALQARLSQQALVKLAELISTLGDDETKTRAGARLVEIETEMEGEEFLNWFKERLRIQMRERAPDTEPDERRITMAAALNRENYITLGALPAMKHLNAVEAVGDRLLEIASRPSTNEAQATRRVKALQAMEGAVRSSQITSLLDIALGTTAPDEVKDYAFDRVADARDVSALTRLWPTFDSATDWRVRWRVGSLILTIGGSGVVERFFQHLTAESYAREELHGYGERLSQIRPAPSNLMNTKLRSERWFDRAIGLYFWERRATETDLPRITALSSDAAATAGEHWEDQDTLGKVAEAVAIAIRERLQQAARSTDSGADSNADSNEGDTEPDNQAGGSAE